MDKVILIVEDDEKNLRLIRDLLQVKGYEILEAGDGKRGVELAQEKKPDLILMDIQLPVLDGLEATRMLKEDTSTKEINVLALTSYAMSGDEKKILEAGCDGYLTKPIDVKQFLGVVDEYLQG